MANWLQTIGWLACVVYATIPAFWLMIHPRAAYWRTRRAPYPLLASIWFSMWIALGAITAPWRLSTIYDSVWAWIPAVLLFGCGAYLYAHAGRGFSLRQLGGVPEIVAGHGEQRLVTGGIRSRVRHPVYLAHLCEMLAWSVGTGLAVNFLLTGFALVTGAVMVSTEDRELERRFGEEFRVYRARVPAIVPRMTL